MLSEVIKILIPLLIQVETSGLKNPPDGDGGEAVGVLQIHKIFVDDVNRITKSYGITGLSYNYKDREDEFQSIQMAKVYLRYYGGKLDSTYTETSLLLRLARIYNDGYSGSKKPSTERSKIYRAKILKLYREK